MIRFGSRGSDLALTQTRLVANALQEQTGTEFSIDVIETRGDRNIDTPIAEIGGKGLFTAELESALREDLIARVAAVPCAPRGAAGHRAGD